MQKNSSGWNSIIYKEHLDIQWNETEESFIINNVCFDVRHFKPNNKKREINENNVTIGDFNLKTNKHLNKLIIEKKLEMFLDDSFQLGIVSKILKPTNIKIFDNIINNNVVSDHTLIIFDVDSENLINNNNNKREGFYDYIHIKNQTIRQKAKNISGKWKASTIINTLNNNTIREFNEFYKCINDKFNWNTYSLIFWINDNKLRKISKEDMVGSKAKDAYNKNTADYLNWNISQLWGMRKNFSARMFFILKNNKLGPSFLNLRPISIIPAWWKLIELKLKETIEEYMETQVQNSITQNYGYRKNKGTVEAIMNIKHKLDTGRYNTIVHLDIAKAYDSITIEKYIKLRDKHGIETKNKMLTTDVCRCLTHMGLIINNNNLNKTRGLAQGSTLSPFIFIIFFDWLWKEIYLMMPDLTINLFVDDTIWLTNDTIELIEAKLKKLESIFLLYGLRINMSKTIIYNSDWEARNTEFGMIVNKECKILGITLQLTKGIPTFNKEKLNNCKINKQIYTWSFHERIKMARTFISSKILYKWAFSLWETIENKNTNSNYNSFGFSKTNFINQRNNYKLEINNKAKPKIIHENKYSKFKAKQLDIERKYYNLIRNFIGFKQISTEELNILNLGYASMVPKIYEIYNKYNPGKEMNYKENETFQTCTTIGREKKNKIMENLKNKIEDKQEIFIMDILSHNGKFLEGRIYNKININIIKWVWDRLEQCIKGSWLDLNRIRSNLILLCINTKHKIGKEEFKRHLREYATWHNKHATIIKEENIDKEITKIFPIFKIIKQ